MEAITGRSRNRAAARPLLEGAHDTSPLSRPPCIGRKTRRRPKGRRPGFRAGPESISLLEVRADAQPGGTPGLVHAHRLLMAAQDGAAAAEMFREVPVEQIVDTGGDQQFIRQLAVGARRYRGDPSLRPRSLPTIFPGLRAKRSGHARRGDHAVPISHPIAAPSVLKVYRFLACACARNEAGVGRSPGCRPPDGQVS